MATAAKAFYGHITHNPRVLGGRACIRDPLAFAYPIRYIKPKP